MIKGKTPLDLGARCKGCPFSVKGFPAKAVLGEGPADCIGVMVGESPGRDEVERRRPFVGATGSQLDESLIAAKLPRAKLFIVNAIACQPRLGKSEGEMRRAADRCRPALLAQLEALDDPDGVPYFLMGKWAVYGVLGSFKKWAQRQGFIQTSSMKRLRILNEETLTKLRKKAEAHVTKRRKQQQPAGK